MQALSYMPIVNKLCLNRHGDMIEVSNTGSCKLWNLYATGAVH